MGYLRIPWPHRDPLEQAKLLNLVHIDTNTDGCWEWLGVKDANGYGVFSSKTLPRLAHRAVWTALKGEITIGLFICHKCNNPSCCNPAHLYVGTHQDNMNDRACNGFAVKMSTAAAKRMSIAVQKRGCRHIWAETLSRNIAVVSYQEALWK